MRRIGGLATALLIGLLSVADSQETSPSSKSKSAPRPIKVKVPARKEPVSYSNDVAGFLEDKCVGCHGSALAENKLSLEDVPAMLKGGKHGSALVPGKADESLLFKMAAHRVEPVMPPKDKPANSPLDPDELGLLKLWIDAGAKDDSAEHEGEAKTKTTKTVVLGELPPGVHPVGAVDMIADGARVAAGRANVVQVYDVDSGREIVTLGGHKDLIQSLRFSPDGSLLAAGSYQIVTLWTAPTGSPQKTLTGHAGPVQALVVSADGKHAISGGQDKTLRGWDLAQGKQDWTTNLPAPITALALSADGKTIYTGATDGIIRAVGVDDRKEYVVLKGHTGPIEGLSVLQGPRLASASADGTARLWTIPDQPAGKAASKPAKPTSIVLSGHKGAVRAVISTTDSRAIITAGDDATLRLWDVKDGGPKGTIATGHSGPIVALACSPDGKLIATGSADRMARVITLADGKPVRTLTGHAGAVQSVAFSPRGDRLATAGADGGIKVWESASSRGVIAFGHAAPGGGAIQPLRQVAFASDGRLVSASADSTLKTWAFSGTWAEKKTLGPHADRVLALDFSPDGKLLAAGGGEPSRSGELKIWQVESGQLLRSLDALHSDTVFALRFSPDGTKLASAAADKFLKVTSVADGKDLRSFEGHTHHVMAVDWKSDGKQIITGGADKVLKLWDLDSGEQVRTLTEAGKQITAARWIADKPEVVAASGDAHVRTWNPNSGAVARTFAGPSDYVYAVAASADGSRLAAGGADGALFIWNGQNSQVLRKIDPLPPRAAAAAASR
jgi:WD40 repeat protein